jgi:hypothetical protein
MMAKRKSSKGIMQKLKEDNERGARGSVLEELFYDFNRSRSQIFMTNFFRGIFFGIGSVIGGALIIALGAMVLGMFVDLPGGIGDFVQRILDAMQNRR